MSTSSRNASVPRIDERTRQNGSLVHVFSSSYLGRLFKNPFALTNIAPFKMRPMRSRAERYTLPERPLTGRACGTCFDSTTLEQWDHSVEAELLVFNGQQNSQKSRLGDILALPSSAFRASYRVIKRIADIVHCTLMDVHHEYPRVDDAVLASERVQEGIRKNVKRHKDAEEDTLSSVGEHDLLESTIKQEREASNVDSYFVKERKRAQAALKRMRAHVSGFALKVAAYVLFKLLRVILRTVQFSPEQIEKVKKAAKKNMPVIYLPNHRSHLDYILLTFILVQFGIRAPYVAAGDNLDIPVFSWILRSLGAFFIKRKLDKDYVYRAVLHSYIEELLKKDESLEFFVEAGRSRTGRPILPKAGLLSVVIETYLQGQISDAYVVPVSVSYEKLIEGNFNLELMGEPKKKETFWAAIKGIWNVFCTKYGSVRIDFGQPVSVKTYLDGLRQHMPPASSSDSSLSSRSVLDFQQKPQQAMSMTLTSRMSLISLCSGIDSAFVDDENRRLIKAMCNHIVYDFSRNTALMCTQMLAFLLTTKYRRGGRLDDIADDFHWLCRRVIACGRDIGFSGDPRDVVRYAIELLGFDLVTLEISDIDSGVGSDSGLCGWNAIGSGARYEKEFGSSDSHLWIVKPTTTLPKVLELAYYAAPVSLVFLQEAVVANALLSASLEASKSRNKNGTIQSTKIIDHALALTDLLQHEFLFTKPCMSMKQSLEQTLDRMVQDGLLVKRAYSTASSASPSSTYGVRFCLEKNQTFGGTTSSAASSHGSSNSLNGLDDDAPAFSVPEKQAKRAGRREDVFFFASEDDELADYEDEVDEDDDLFGKREPNPSISRRGSSYTIASLVDGEDEYNADVIRLYASTIAPLLEAYRFSFKATLATLTRSERENSRAVWKTESELLRTLITQAKAQGMFVYAESVNMETMRNAIRWLVLKGVLLSSHDRLRVHDWYFDNREALDRFCSEIDDLCVVVQY